MNKISGWWRRLGASMCLVAVAIMSGCGGGSGNGGADAQTPPVSLPDSVSITAPATAETASEVQFSSSAASLSGVSFSWDFGDGLTSTEASPKHKYAKGGDYSVLLKISNSAGASREQKAQLSIASLANVKGLTCSGANSSGWCWQQPLPNGNPRTGTFIATASTFFTIDDSGGINKSTDAGVSWTQQVSGVTSSLVQVKFSNPQDGWIVGANGVLLRSADGGANWMLNKMPDGLQLDTLGQLTVVDAKKAFFATSRTYTSDGGKTWSTSSFQPTQISRQGIFWRFDANGELLRSTDFGLSSSTVADAKASGFLPGDTAFFSLIDDQTLAISWSHVDNSPGHTPYTRTVLLSFDGGLNWRRIDPKSPGTDQLPAQSPIKILRASASDGSIFATVSNWYASSIDGGLSWVRINPPNSLSMDNAWIEGQMIVAPSLVGFYDAPPNITGGSNYGYWLAWSSDAGRTWANANISGLTPPNSVSSASDFINLRRIDSETLGMQDTSGRSFTSTDNGRNWKLVLDSAPLVSSTPTSPGAPWFPPPSPAMLSFLDSKRGLMLTLGDVKETSDGGRSWAVKLRSALPGSAVITSLQFVNGRIAWLLQGDGRLFQSADAGATWDGGQIVRGGLSSVQFTDERRGWGRLLDGSGFVLTRDGGQTWTLFNVPSPWLSVHGKGLLFGTGSRILVYGYSALFATSEDDGKSWHAFNTSSDSPFANIFKVAASDDTTLWKVDSGSGLAYSKNGGSTWTTSLPRINDFAFADALHGWAVSNDGLIMATTDGGKTWAQQASGTHRTLITVVVNDSKTAWIIGESGTLLATGNGGF